jgi:hypothetical protein
MLIVKLLKPVLAAAAVAGAVAAAPAAQAGTDVDVYFGVDPGWGFYDAGVYVDPYHHHRRHHHVRRVSCYEGKQRVKWAGFHKVRPVDCDGVRYRYKARKHGDWFIVTLNARRGHIIDVREIY